MRLEGNLFYFTHVCANSKRIESANYVEKSSHPYSNVLVVRSFSVHSRNARTINRRSTRERDAVFSTRPRSDHKKRLSTLGRKQSYLVLCSSSLLNMRNGKRVRRRRNHSSSRAIIQRCDSLRTRALSLCAHACAHKVTSDTNVKCFFLRVF